MTVTAGSRGAFAIQGSDIRGFSRLSVDACVGLTDLVEGMHHAIGKRTGIFGAAPAGRTSGITGMVYRAVRGTMRLVGGTVDVLLGALSGEEETACSSVRRDALIAALNGVWGDHFADTDNPLAIPMALRAAGAPIDPSDGRLAAAIPRPGGKVLVLVHGLCMSDLHWTRRGHDHGLALARDHGFTPLYLRYNSGRHVSQNGSEFAAMLERLVAHWPVPLEELVIVGHSMGGLVARSACHYGLEAGHRWLASLRRLVFLGTPHHGTALERGGHLVELLLGASPYLAPFARLGRARSAGITDLRFGNLQHADWKGRDRHEQSRDDRRPTPLPAGVQAYAIAGCTARRADGVRARAIGDGLVPLPSALGEHRDPAHVLALPSSHRCIFAPASHWDLLCRADVYARLRGWLAPGKRRGPRRPR
jgi:pimeloyl-ACP methyl ester carboxylesterase